MAALAVIVMGAGACSAAESAADEPTVGESPVETSRAEDFEFGASLDEFLGTDVEEPTSSAPPDGFEEIQWEDLIPPGSEDDASARFDERIAAVEPGSSEADAVYAELQADYDNLLVNAEMSGDAVYLAGFAAPLTYAEELVTEFLLVPYFGACIPRRLPIRRSWSPCKKDKN